MFIKSKFKRNQQIVNLNNVNIIEKTDDSWGRYYIQFFFSKAKHNDYNDEKKIKTSYNWDDILWGYDNEDHRNEEFEKINKLLKINDFGVKD